MDIRKFKWIRQPEQFEIGEDRITITTMPRTDLWQRTYYHFRNDNAPVLQMETEEAYFSFIVKTNFEDSHQRFDQCGIVMYLDSDPLNMKMSVFSILVPWSPIMAILTGRPLRSRRM